MEGPVSRTGGFVLCKCHVREVEHCQRVKEISLPRFSRTSDLERSIDHIVTEAAIADARDMEGPVRRTGGDVWSPPGVLVLLERWSSERLDEEIFLACVEKTGVEETWRSQLQFSTVQKENRTSSCVVLKTLRPDRATRTAVKK